jgi:uncharacterized protein
MIAQAAKTSSITEAITTFFQLLRNYGFNIGLLETQEALLCIQHGILEKKDHFKYALRSIACKSPEEINYFESIFESYWGTNLIDAELVRSHVKTQGVVTKKEKASLVMAGFGSTTENTGEAKQVSGVNETERLKTTDLTHLVETDLNKLHDIAAQLFKEMAARMKRKEKKAKNQKVLHLRKTIRKSISSGGEPINLIFKKKERTKQRLILMLDVSGSMDKYSYFLLLFIVSLRAHFKQMEVFLFSTTLRRISKTLYNSTHTKTILKELTKETEIWSSGTKIGKSLAEFNNKYGKRMLNGSPVVIMLSDGLETGDADELGRELKKIQSRSKKLVWLNPLKGMINYEPKTKGMIAALPSIDDFRSAHNLHSLLELEKIIMYA